MHSGGSKALRQAEGSRRLMEEPERLLSDGQARSLRPAPVDVPKAEPDPCDAVITGEQGLEGSERTVGRFKGGRMTVGSEELGRHRHEQGLLIN
jgi:hypothetical protein